VCIFSRGANPAVELQKGLFADDRLMQEDMVEHRPKRVVGIGYHSGKRRSRPLEISHLTERVLPPPGNAHTTAVHTTSTLAAGSNNSVTPKRAMAG
jgi:hypothetical protein